MVRNRFSGFRRPLFILLLWNLAILCVVFWKDGWIQQHLIAPGRNYTLPTPPSVRTSGHSTGHTSAELNRTKDYGTKARLVFVPREGEMARPEELFSTPENHSWIYYMPSGDIVLDSWLGPTGNRHDLEEYSTAATENNTTKHGLVKGVRKRRRLGMSRQEILVYLDLVDVFTTSLSRANLTYFLYSGSLLGSWRHHGIVPWDDDVDFAVSFHERHNVSQVLKSIGPGYHLYEGQRVRWKFFSDHSYPISGQPWRWPFLDISWFVLDGSVLRDFNSNKYPQFRFNVSDVFPLVKRPFMGRMLPVPHNTEAVLRKTYSRLHECQLGTYDHRVEDAYPDAPSINCSDLHRLYPFVHRVSVQGKAGCNETLVKNGTVVSWLFQLDFQC